MSVLYSISEGVATVTLNRPERLNAMPPAMADELGQAFYDLGDARAVLITGEGKGFCSGADLAARGWKFGTDVLTTPFPGHDHSERAWSARIHLVLQWWLNGLG